MQENQNKPDQIFKQRFENAESASPLEDWSSVKFKLQNKGMVFSTAPVKSYTRQIVAAAIILLFLNIGAWWIIVKDSNNQEVSSSVYNGKNIQLHTTSKESNNTKTFDNYTSQRSENKSFRSPDLISENIEIDIENNPSPRLPNLMPESKKVNSLNVNRKTDFTKQSLVESSKTDKIDPNNNLTNPAFANAPVIPKSGDLHPAAASDNFTDDKSFSENRNIYSAKIIDSNDKTNNYIDCNELAVADSHSLNDSMLFIKSRLAFSSLRNSTKCSDYLRNKNKDDKDNLNSNKFNIFNSYSHELKKSKAIQESISKEIVVNDSVASSTSTNALLQSKVSDSLGLVLKLDTTADKLVANTNEKTTLNRLPPTISFALSSIPAISKMQYDYFDGTVVRTENDTRSTFLPTIDGQLTANVTWANGFVASTGLAISNFQEKFIQEIITTQTWTTPIIPGSTTINGTPVNNTNANFTNAKNVNSNDANNSYSVQNTFSSPVKVDSVNNSRELIAVTKISNRYQFIGVPIMVGFSKSIKKFAVSVYSGTLINFRTNKNIVIVESGLVMNSDASSDIRNSNQYFANDEYSILKTSGDKFYQEEKIKKISLMYVGGVDVSYPLSSHFRIIGGPTMKVAMQSVTQSKHIKTLPYSFGFKAGLSFTL